MISAAELKIAAIMDLAHTYVQVPAQNQTIQPQLTTILPTVFGARASTTLTQQVIRALWDNAHRFAQRQSADGEHITAQADDILYQQK